MNKNIDISKRTKGDYSTYGELDNLTIEVTKNKGTEDEYYERIATVTGYDNHKADYDKWAANAAFIVLACNNYDKLVEAVKESIGYGLALASHHENNVQFDKIMAYVDKQRELLKSLETI